MSNSPEYVAFAWTGPTKLYAFGGTNTVSSAIGKAWYFNAVYLSWALKKLIRAYSKFIILVMRKKFL